MRVTGMIKISSFIQRDQKKGVVFKYLKDRPMQVLLNFFVVPEDIRAKDRKSQGNGFRMNIYINKFLALGAHLHSSIRTEKIFAVFMAGSLV